MDVTSGIVGHLLFMGRGPGCEMCVSVCARSKNLLQFVYEKLESHVHV